ncbi:voltage-gated Ca2+ channel, alpha subunit, partial [Reticulomyxa filosa]
MTEEKQDVELQPTNNNQSPNESKEEYVALVQDTLKKSKQTITETQLQDVDMDIEEEEPKVQKKIELKPPDDLQFVFVLLENDWKRAQWWIRHGIVQSKWFELFILITIIVNCVMLALDNPRNNSKQLENGIQISEYVFTAVYLMEMVTKLLGFGVWGIHEERGKKEREQKEQKETVMPFMIANVFHSEKEVTNKEISYVGYFNDGWNCFDFTIIVVGSIVPLFTATKSISSLRALRILRALRTIPRVPSYIHYIYIYIYIY